MLIDIDKKFKIYVIIHYLEANRLMIPSYIVRNTGNTDVQRGNACPNLHRFQIRTCGTKPLTRAVELEREHASKSNQGVFSRLHRSAKRSRRISDSHVEYGRVAATYASTTAASTSGTGDRV